MTRRDFAAFFGTAAASGQRRLDLSTTPNFCSHEHWGSIESIGTIPGGYRCDYEQGARPHGMTTLFDLLMEPYLRGVLLSSGVNRDQLARSSGWKWYQNIQQVLRPYVFSGIHQCTRRGI